MPRKATSLHDFTKRAVNPPMERAKRGAARYQSDLPLPFVLHRLPRLDSTDSREAAREAAGGGNFWSYFGQLYQVASAVQHQPVVVGLNWYDNFDHPVKHPFRKARREQFFIGENGLGELRGSWHLVACGWHRSRGGREWVRLQNCWGYDYPLVWMPMTTIEELWDNGEFEASIAV